MPAKLSMGGHDGESALERLDRQVAAELKYAKRLQERKEEERARRSIQHSPTHLRECALHVPGIQSLVDNLFRSAQERGAGSEDDHHASAPRCR